MNDKTLAVQRMQDYIELHLNEPINLSQLSEAACFSPWYAARIFRELTGLAPAEYIRRLRLSKSALRLRDERVKVIDAALDAGFESVDGYQRAFRREFGLCPKEYALQPVPLPLFTAYGVKFRELWKKERTDMANEKSIFIQIVEKPARRILIKRGIKAADYFAYCEEVGCDVWGMLVSMKSLCGEPVCLWLPEPYRAGKSEYVQGVEVSADYDGPMPESFDMVELPAATYLMFQSEPFAEEDYCSVIEALQAAMNRYEPSILGYVWDDANPRIQLEPRGERGYIELRAIKKA